jgi:hypothetical protein
MALAKPLGMSERELLMRLPFARGQQYLCALALNNGASPVWMDEHDSQADVVESARGILRAALKRE